MIRRATMYDLKKIMYIVDETKEEMRSQGNDQFDNVYPIEKHFSEDIENGHLYIRCSGIDIAGIMCINNEDLTSANNLSWSKVTPCTSMYRLIVNRLHRKRGIARELIETAEDISRRQGLNYVKAATYELNKPMMALFSKLGYELVGKVKIDTKMHPFYYYEKVL